MEEDGVRGVAAVAPRVVVGEVAAEGVVGAVVGDEVRGTPPRWIQELPLLGVGLGFRKSLKKEILARPREIDFLELILEQYIEPSFGQLRELRHLSRVFPLIPHGLGLSLGSADFHDAESLKEFASVVKRVRPPWWSDHIAMTRAGPLDIGHLAPVPFTEEMVRIICRNIATVKSILPVPLVLENISYTHHFYGNELTEAEFLTAILERSNCGLLLDVMNLYANSQNHCYDPFRFLDQIPLERVVQVHVIGGRREGGILVDSHSSPAPAEVWDLLRYVARRTQVKAVLVEWDEHFPPFEVICRELSMARDILVDPPEVLSQRGAYAFR